jgi:hypothetical protein
MPHNWGKWQGGASPREGLSHMARRDCSLSPHAGRGSGGVPKSEAFWGARGEGFSPTTKSMEVPLTRRA